MPGGSKGVTGRKRLIPSGLTTTLRSMRKKKKKKKGHTSPEERVLSLKEPSGEETGSTQSLASILSPWNSTSPLSRAGSEGPSSCP